MDISLSRELLILLLGLNLLTLWVFLGSYLKNKIISEKMNHYYFLAKTTVYSVEQTLGSGNGMDKKEEARQILKLLTKNKLKDHEIDRLIEAVVYEMNTSPK